MAYLCLLSHVVSSFVAIRELLPADATTLYNLYGADCVSSFMIRKFYYIMEIIGAAQTYDWGKWGRFSAVAKLAAANIPGFVIDESESYAEFWMGTHPNGPAKIAGNNEDLADWIKCNPDSLGVSKCEFGNSLPFLLKVLSINKPLSIQAHPDKVCTVN